MITPPKWDSAVLAAESKAATKHFRKERLLEPLEKWKRAVEQNQALFRQLFRVYGLHDPGRLTPEQVAEIFRFNLGDALRYLVGPPISKDDLKVLAESSLAPSVLAKRQDEARRVLEIISQALDSKRFPWVEERRAPEKDEEAAAILASAVLLTAQRVSTDRRSEGKATQEATVQKRLKDMGFKPEKPRTIRTLTDAPAPGQFCGESLVGSRKADIVVRLLDGRLMPIECKVSNSSTNSVKRLNNDAAVKAAIWHRELGTKQVVPTAVLSGVFKVLNLEQAQDGGLTIFWAHKLDELEQFVLSARPVS